MSSGELIGLLCGLGAALVFGLAAVGQALAVRRTEEPSRSLLGFMSDGVRDPLTWAVGLSYLAGFGLHATAIRELPLYLAQTLVSLSLPVTAIASMALGERLRPLGWASVAGVVLGTSLVASGAGGSGSGQGVGVLPFLAVLALAVVLLAATARRRWPATALATCAGFGYAGVALAVRGVGTGSLGGWVCLAVLPFAGVLTFWVYSLAMSMGAVASATSALVVVQTLAPALAGVALLGDEVRDGWWPALAAGLVLAVVGAAALERRSAEATDQVPAAS